MSYGIFVSIQLKTYHCAISAFICAVFCFPQVSAANEDEAVSSLSQKKPVLEVESDGLPFGHDTPEGAASMFAVAFIRKDVELYRDVRIPPFGGGDARKAYECFLERTESVLKAEAAKSWHSPTSARAIGKLYAVRHFSRSGPASYGKEIFGFQDVAFVDVGVIWHDGTQHIERTLVIKSSDGLWYVYPAPSILPRLSEGLLEESRGVDFRDAYEIRRRH